MSTHTIKSYLMHLKRYDPATGKERKKGERAVLRVNAFDILLDEVHADFILGTLAMVHGTTGEWVPVPYATKLTQRQAMLPIANITNITVQQ